MNDLKGDRLKGDHFLEFVLSMSKSRRGRDFVESVCLPRLGFLLALVQTTTRDVTFHDCRSWKFNRQWA